MACRCGCPQVRRDRALIASAGPPAEPARQRPRQHGGPAGALAPHLGVGMEARIRDEHGGSCDNIFWEDVTMIGQLRLQLLHRRQAPPELLRQRLHQPRLHSATPIGFFRSRNAYSTTSRSFALQRSSPMLGLSAWSRSGERGWRGTSLTRPSGRRTRLARPDPSASPGGRRGAPREDLPRTVADLPAIPFTKTGPDKKP
jgi:hypothetical protein